jgi:hypothetical protein
MRMRVRVRVREGGMGRWMGAVGEVEGWRQGCQKRERGREGETGRGRDKEASKRIVGNPQLSTLNPIEWRGIQEDCRKPSTLNPQPSIL